MIVYKMNPSSLRKIILLLLIVVLASCQSKNEPYASDSNGVLLKDKAFVAVLEKHLKAVSDRDTTALKSTLSPENNTLLILPGLEMATSKGEFLEYHKNWFKDTTWTAESKILITDIGDKMGIAATEIIYREPERNGKPYFNRMVISYSLKEIEGQWYVVLSHGSTVEMSVF